MAVAVAADDGWSALLRALGLSKSAQARLAVQRDDYERGGRECDPSEDDFVGRYCASF
jgi:hypothetical protein